MASKPTWAKIVVVGSALALSTPIRAGLVFMYPIMIPLLLSGLELKISRGTIVVAILAATTTIIAGASEGFIWPNHVLSLLFWFAIIAVVFARPFRRDLTLDGFAAVSASFWRAITWVQLVNNGIGVVQFATAPDADAFVGLYSRHGMSVHGLGIVNAFVFLHYWAAYSARRVRRDLILAVIFGLSFVMAGYGLGLLFLAGSFVFTYLWTGQVRLRAMAIPLGLLIIALVTVGGGLLEYNIASLKIATQAITEGDIESFPVPRKFLVFYGYEQAYVEGGAGRFLFGSGPGTFNSRTSFLFNGDHIDQATVFEERLGVHVPPLADEFVYPLWNPTILAIPFQDGTINQPFSSAVTLLSEYGVIVSAMIAALLIAHYRPLLRQLRDAARDGSADARAMHLYLKLSTVFVLLLCLGENLVEFTEIWMFVLPFKLIDGLVSRSWQKLPGGS